MISHHFKFMYCLNHISIRTLDDTSRIILHFGPILQSLIRLSYFWFIIFCLTGFGPISVLGLLLLSTSHLSFSFILFPYPLSNSSFRVNRSFKSRAFISFQPNILSLFRVESPSFLRVKFDTIRALVTLCTYSNLNISSASLRKDNIKYEACHLPRLVFHL